MQLVSARIIDESFILYINVKYHNDIVMFNNHIISKVELYILLSRCMFGIIIIGDNVIGSDIPKKRKPCLQLQLSCTISPSFRIP